MESRVYCPTIYGPVKSRRHGISLGINLGVPEQKICTWGCLYCQCGHGERRGFEAGDPLLSFEEIVELLTSKLTHLPKIDSVTFAGNTEPGLYPGLGTLVRELKKLRYAMRAEWKICCLSNGSELDHPEVLGAFRMMDEIWIKLDTADPVLFLRMNRPMGNVASLEDHFRRMKRVGKLRVQTLLWETPRVPELSNSTESRLAQLKEAFLDLQPLAIHVTTIDRVPAWKEMQPVSLEKLESFVTELNASGLKAQAFPHEEGDEEERES